MNKEQNIANMFLNGIVPPAIKTFGMCELANAKAKRLETEREIEALMPQLLEIDYK